MNHFFTNEVLKTIGGKYGKSVAQTALRFLIQRGVIVIPKSAHKERMIENFDVFDFVLTDDDMQTIAQLVVRLGERVISSFYTNSCFACCSTAKVELAKIELSH